MAPHHDTPASDENGQKWVSPIEMTKQAAIARNGGILPESPALVTSWFPNCEIWSAENLPEILFYFILPPSRYRGIKVEYIIENGQRIPDSQGGYLRELEILPRKISLEVPAWLVEAWKRIDPRIKYSDILGRQQEHLDFGGPGQHLKIPNRNALQNRCSRQCRKLLSYWPNYNRRPLPHRNELLTLENLAFENIKYNSVLPMSHDESRLLRVKLVQKKPNGAFTLETVKVGADDIMQHTFPLDHFSKGIPTPGMTPFMKAAYDLLLVLKERAEIHGLDDWSKLQKKCVPKSWYDRTGRAAGRAWLVPADGGCGVCKWTGAENADGYNTSDTETNEWKQKSKKRKQQREARKASNQTSYVEETSVEQASVEISSPAASVRATDDQHGSLEATGDEKTFLGDTVSEQVAEQSTTITSKKRKRGTTKKQKSDVNIDPRLLTVTPSPTMDLPAQKVVNLNTQPPAVVDNAQPLTAVVNSQSSTAPINNQSPIAVVSAQLLATVWAGDEWKLTNIDSTFAGQTVHTSDLGRVVTGQQFHQPLLPVYPPLAHGYGDADLSDSPAGPRQIPTRVNLSSPDYPRLVGLLSSPARPQQPPIASLFRGSARPQQHPSASSTSWPDWTLESPTGSGANDFQMSDLLDMSMLDSSEEVDTEDDGPYGPYPRPNTPEPLPIEWLD